MKNVMKNIGLLVALVVMTIGSAWAQDSIGAQQRHHRYDVNNNLTDEQKAEIAAARAEREAQRAAFIATLSEEQLAILNNTELSRDEKQELLRSTLSDEQLAMLDGMQAAREAQQAERAAAREARQADREARQADRQAKRQEMWNNLTDEEKQEIIQNRRQRRGGN